MPNKGLQGKTYRPKVSSAILWLSTHEERQGSDRTSQEKLHAEGLGPTRRPEKDGHKGYHDHKVHNVLA